jgi:type I restriction enzyme, S subunit
MSWYNGVLQDLVFLQRGFDITKAEQQPGMIPVISSSGVNSFHSEPKVKGPGIIVGRKGTVGSVHFSETDFWPHDTTLWSKDLKGNNPKFIYYFLQTLQLSRYDTGNSNPTLNRNHIHNLPIRKPDRATQDRIADILSAYDDLIGNNRRRIKLLEEAARQLYREWFVRLRFPGHEHTKIVDGVPEGWGRRILGELCERITDGSHWSPKEVDEGMPMASVKDMQEWDFDVDTCRQISDEDYRQLISNDCRPRLGDILVAKDGANLNKHTFLIVEERELVILSSIAILRPLQLVNSEFLTATLKSDVVSQALKNKVSGAAIPRIVLKDFRNLQLLVPPRPLQDGWEQSCGASMQLCRKLTKINNQLAKARNLLLPRLMDGRIAV